MKDIKNSGSWGVANDNVWDLRTNCSLWSLKVVTLLVVGRVGVAWGKLKKVVLDSYKTSQVQGLYVRGRQKEEGL